MVASAWPVAPEAGVGRQGKEGEMVTVICLIHSLAEEEASVLADAAIKRPQADLGHFQLSIGASSLWEPQAAGLGSMHFGKSAVSSKVLWSRETDQGVGERGPGDSGEHRGGHSTALQLTVGFGF